MRLLKLGGTSVATASRRAGVATLVEGALRRDAVVVVTSALAGVTDQLTAAIAGAIDGENPQRRRVRLEVLRRLHLDDLPLPANQRCQIVTCIETHLRELRRCLDGIALLGDCPATTQHRVLALGERMALPLLTLALRQRGLDAVGVDGAQLLCTGSADDTSAGDPEVDIEESRRRSQAWYRGLTGNQVPVITGFVAADARGRTTTLGRGASDLTATLVGSFLAADGIEIWTDVDGVLTASPRWVETPRRLPHLSYAEASEMARFGARVLHPRTLEPLLTTRIPVRIRNTAEPQRAGTRIGPQVTDQGSLSASKPGANGIRAISACTGNVLLRLDGDGFALRRELCGALDVLDIEPLLWVDDSGGSSVSVVITAECAAPALRQLRRRFHKTHHHLTVETRHKVGLVAAIGEEAEPTWILGRMLEALSAEAIEGLALALPCLSGNSRGGAVAVLVDDAEVPRAVRRLHRDLISEDLIAEDLMTEERVAETTAAETPPALRAQSMSLRRAQSRHEPLMRLL